jgi:hypothetical protein
MEPRKRMSVKEFREAGYLQELNRRFLHPLGLALEVVVNEECSRCEGTGNYTDRDSTDDRLCPKCDGSGKRSPEEVTEHIGGVWDYRDDPEGLIFGPGIIDPEKAKRVYDEHAAKRHMRIVRLGFDIQPVDEDRV